MDFINLFKTKQNIEIELLLKEIAKKMDYCNNIMNIPINEKEGNSNVSYNIYNTIVALFGKSKYSYNYFNKKILECDFFVLFDIKNHFKNNINIANSCSLRNSFLPENRPDHTECYYKGGLLDLSHNILFDKTSYSLKYYEYEITFEIKKDKSSKEIKLKNLNIVLPIKYDKQALINTLNIMIEKIDKSCSLYSNISKIYKNDFKDSKEIENLLELNFLNKELKIIIALFSPENVQDILLKKLLNEKIAKREEILEFVIKAESEIYGWHYDNPYFANGDDIIMAIMRDMKNDILENGNIGKKISKITLENQLIETNLPNVKRNKI